MLEGMSEEKPFVLRLAAGLVATGIEQIKRLPEDLPSWSVSAAGTGVRAWLRLQQEISSIASRGDEFLAGFSTPPEQAEWATFDDLDDEVSAAPAPESVPDAVMEGYNDYSIAQVRARLRGLSVDDLRHLLRYEQQQQNRAAFVTLLGNRLEKLRAEGETAGS